MALTTPRRKLAALLAAGDRTFEQIAVELNVPLRTLKRWASLPEVADCVEQIAAKAAAALEAKGITEKANRLRDYQDIRAGLLEIKRQRAEAGALTNVPGADTGLLVRGEFGYVADKPLVDALLANNKQAAIEMEQWTERRQSDDKLAIAAGDELAALERSLSRLAAAGRATGGAGQPDAGATEPPPL